MGKQIGFGVQIQIGDSTNGASTSWTAIANIAEEPSGPQYQVTSVDATDHQSPNYFKEFIPGLIDGGQVQLQLNYEPAQATHQLLHTLATNRQTRDFRVVNPDDVNSFYQFVAFVETLGPPSYPTEGMMRLPVTLKIAGAVTYTPTP